MVDVTSKPWTERRARARCCVKFSDAAGLTVDPSVRHAGVDWSELFTVARTAGVQAAKATATLIPLCHPLNISGLDVRLRLTAEGVEIEGVAEVTGPTGVEMEALTACAVAGLCVIAGLSPTEEVATLEELTLWEKSGCRSGTWTKP